MDVTCCSSIDVTNRRSLSLKTGIETHDSATHDACDIVCEDGIRRRLKGTSGLALPCCMIADNARPDVVFWRELAESATAFDKQIRRSRWVDIPDSADLIGKTSIVGTAIVINVPKG